MKKLCTMILMALVLVLGLRGFSASEDSPYQVHQFQIITGPNADHPWGGDQGQGGGGGGSGSGGGTTGAVRPVLPSVNTGNVIVDFVINRVTWRSNLWRYVIVRKPQGPSVRTTVTPSAPATGGNHNSAN